MTDALTSPNQLVLEVTSYFPQIYKEWYRITESTERNHKCSSMRKVLFNLQHFEHFYGFGHCLIFSLSSFAGFLWSWTKLPFSAPIPIVSCSFPSTSLLELQLSVPSFQSFHSAFVQCLESFLPVCQVPEKKRAHETWNKTPWIWILIPYLWKLLL